jgi:hypothetical protein
MAEWGPSEVTETLIRRMEEEGLAPKDVFVVGWHSPIAGQSLPEIDD